MKYAAMILTLTLLLAIPADVGAAKITTPKQQFGHNLGDDYFLANYQQLVEYWQKLEHESPRMKLEVIGKTEEGRDILMAIITSPSNHKNLQRYKEIARKLALAEGLDEKEARKLAAEGRAVVWIDGGLHASEILVAQQLMEMAYQMVSRKDKETKRFLRDIIVLLVNPNPDGQDLVADWYMRHEDPKQRSTRSLPRLYQKYTGHDNNRDFYMVTQKETEACCRVMFQEWFPQIVYNHHQTGPSGTVLFAPPFRGPFNHNFDPLVPLGIDLVGAAMHNRFAVEGKPGATMRRGASYSTWWNGGLRTTTYFHNMIGLLTEMIGHPTPMEIPLRLRRQLANEDLPYPITPQKWHFRQSVEYSITANRAVLDVASRYREHLLFNIYRMGKNSIERGNRDHWTVRPRRIAAAQEAIDRARESAQRRRSQSGGQQEAESRSQQSASTRQQPDIFSDVLRDPAHRDPRGFILPSDQADPLTATKFVNTLMKNGITIHRATAWFQCNGKTYPKGSYVVKCAQAFRPHIIDMFEPQDHPDDIPYPGGPPTPPYDSAGYTLAFQMGVEFDRILDGFDGPFERIEGLIDPEPGTITYADGAAGFLLSHKINDSIIAVNRLLRQGFEVYWLEQPLVANGQEWPVGTIYIPARDKLSRALQGISTDIGLSFAGVAQEPGGKKMRLSPVRIGLWDRYGGSMASGWTRWILEKFEFDFQVVYPQRLDQGNLRQDFDSLLFVSGAIPTSSSSRGFRAPDRNNIPAEYHDRLGRVTVDKTVPQLKEFLEQGGNVLTIGSSTALARHLELPIENALIERQQDGTVEPLGREKYYVPGSVLRVRVDNANPFAYGLDEHVDVLFRRSPVFRLPPAATLQGIRPVAWFDTDSPLRSGWAWGQHHLKDGVAVVEAPVGKGRLLLFGPEVAFRAQPHGTFKFLFNGLYSHVTRPGSQDLAARPIEPVAEASPSDN